MNPKLDVIKAFDRLDWTFLLALLDKCGLCGMLTRFLRANFANASSTVLWNGRMTPRVPLACSVRQGYPLSPLLFILTFDALSGLLQEAVHYQKIVGSPSPGLELALCIICMHMISLWS